jgi:hypothetical protein
MGSIGCVETSVTNYESTLRNVPEELRLNFYRGGILNSRVLHMTLDGRILVSFRDSQNVGDFLTGCGTVSF